MRLSENQVKQMISALQPFISPHHAQLKLYGSRVHDHLKGGDIDLLLLTDNVDTAHLLLEKKHRLLAAMKEKLGDQKIDLLIAAKNDDQKDLFIQMILPQSVHLKSF